MTITLTAARTIIRTAMETGAGAGMKPLSVVVLDAGGHVIAFERADGASPGRFDIAQGKAYAAVMMGMTGTALRDRAETQGYFVQAMNGLFGGRFVPVPGGVLVRDGSGVVIAAVGVTGDTSENDAAAALAGIEAAGLTGEG